MFNIDIQYNETKVYQILSDIKIQSVIFHC